MSYEGNKRKRPYGRTIGRNGGVRIPKELFRVLKLEDGVSNQYVTIQETGEGELRIKRWYPGASDLAWKDRQREGRSKLSVDTEKFVQETLESQLDGRVPVTFLQAQYRSWLKAQAAEVERISKIHLGRAVMRVFPDTKRTTGIFESYKQVPVYTGVDFDSNIELADFSAEKEIFRLADEKREAKLTAKNEKRALAASMWETDKEFGAFMRGEDPEPDTDDDNELSNAKPGTSKEAEDNAAVKAELARRKALSDNDDMADLLEIEEDVEGGADDDLSGVDPGS